MIRIVLLTISLVMALAVQAQYEEESKKYKKYKTKSKYNSGTVILKDSTRLEGMIKRYKSYRGIELITKSGKKKILYAKNFIEYQTKSRYVVLTNEFYKVEIDNPNLSLYSQIESNGSYGGVDPISGGTISYGNPYARAYYVKKSSQDSPKYVPSGDGFKRMADYFSDCEAVMKGILSGELKEKSMRHVVGLYNKCE